MASKAKEAVVGIDVSARWLDVSRQREHVEAGRFGNTAAAHRDLARWLTKGGWHARVVLEATGTYSADVALALAAHPRVRVMMANPRAVKKFREACVQRAQTDATSAQILREFAQRMEFVPWTPPSPAALELRALARRLSTVVALMTEERQRLHAARATRQTPAAVLADFRQHLRQLTEHVKRLRTQAQAVIAASPELAAAWPHLLSVKGIGVTSALYLLGELATMAPGLDVRQWVAYAGLDPRPIRSGTSVHPPVHISKLGNVYLRRALYMPALVAQRWNPVVRAYAQKLLAKGKPKMVVLVAVMRKLLHAIHGMLKTNTDFNPEKFYRVPEAA
jgi:transposase